jgi:hypothetical protein
MVDIRSASISQLRRGALEFCVLALLRDGERYGFELVQTLSAIDGMVTTEGTLYPLLGRLRRDGVVETTWRESSALLTHVLGNSSRLCRTYAGNGSVRTCTGGTGGSSHAGFLLVPAALFVLPFVTAVYLARRAQSQPAA